MTRRGWQHLVSTMIFVVSLGGLYAEEPALVSFQASDGGTIYGHLYGSGEHGVVLAHGAVFDKESWSDQAGTLADEGGLHVFAIDFRGYGNSTPGTDHARSISIFSEPLTT